MKRQTAVLLAVFLVSAATGFCDRIQYPVGERLVYRIYWGCLHVGRVCITCEPVTENDTPLIRVRVEAKSNRLVSTLYAVNDQTDCYIDPSTGLPLRVEKKTSEGGFICDDTLWIDHNALVAHWESRSASITTNYPIAPDTLDPASLLYALRSTQFTLHEPQRFKIAVDGLLHGLTITAEETKPVKVGSEMKPCIRFSSAPERSDLFVRKVPGDIWVTADDKQIMVKMRTKIPVGHVQVVLDTKESSY
jgi:hypothetical protein